MLKDARYTITIYSPYISNIIKWTMNNYTDGDEKNNRIATVLVSALNSAFSPYQMQEIKRQLNIWKGNNTQRNYLYNKLKIGRASCRERV